MFAIHADALEQQLFIANNGPNAPELREKQKQLQQQRGKQMQAFTRRHALGDVSNQRREAPVPHQPQKMVQKAAPSQPVNRFSLEAPKKLTRSHEVPNHGTHFAVRSTYTEQLHADSEAQAREQVYLREQALAMEQAQAREQARQQATAWARRQQELQQIHQQQQLQLHHHHQQQQHQQQSQHPQPQQQPVYMQVQQQHHMQMHLHMHQPLMMAMHAPTPMRKKKKKRTARRQPVVQGYHPCLSPLVENIIGELPTPARLAHLSRTTAISSPMPKGVINFQEIPVTNDNASVGNHVVIASQYATHAFFRKYAGKTGILVRKSEAPGGCGWIVDFGAELGRQFFATGGASNVCHLAFANVRSSPNSPAAASPRSPVAPLGLQASPSRASQWAVSSVSSVAVSSVESSLMTLIGTSTRLKQQSSPQPPPEPHAQISNSIQVDLEASSQLSNISIQVANLAAQGEKQVEKLAFNVLGDATATCVLGDASSTSHASASAVNDAPGESPLEAVHEVDEEAEAEDAVAPSPPGAVQTQEAGGNPGATSEPPLDSACQYANYTMLDTGVRHGTAPAQQRSVQDLQHLQPQPLRQHQHPNLAHHSQQQRSGAVSTGPFGSWGATTHGHGVSINYFSAAPANEVQRTSPSNVSHMTRIWDAITKH